MLFGGSRNGLPNVDGPAEVSPRSPGLLLTAAGQDRLFWRGIGKLKPAALAHPPTEESPLDGETEWNAALQLPHQERLKRLSLPDLGDSDTHVLVKSPARSPCEASLNPLLEFLHALHCVVLYWMTIEAARAEQAQRTSCSAPVLQGDCGRPSAALTV